MNTEFQAVNPTREKLMISADASEIKSDFAEVKKGFSNEVTIKGFRKGKAPWSMIEKQYASEIKKEFEKRILNHLVSEAIKGSGKDFYCVVDVDYIELDLATGAKLEVLLDMNPVVEVPDFSAVKIAKPDPKVTDAEIDERIGYIRGLLSNYENADEDYGIQKNDLLDITFTSDLNSDDLDDDAKRFVADKNHWFQLGHDDKLPNLVDVLVGAKLNQPVKHTVTFGDEAIDALKGKTATYEIIVNTVRRQMQASDELLFERMDVTDMEAFRAKIAETLLSAAKRSEMERVSSELSTYLETAATFELSETAIADATRDEVQRIMRNMNHISKEEIRQHSKEIMEAARTSAIKHLKIRQMVLAIAKKEGISLTSEEQSAAIISVAQSLQITPQEAFSRLQQNGRIEEFFADTLFTKVFNDLIARMTAE